MWRCKHCEKEFFDLSPSEKANHTRWCDQNPNREKYLDRLKKTRENIPAESRARAHEKIRKAWKEGKYADVDHGKYWRGKSHSDDSRKRMSDSRAKYLRDNPDKHPWKKSDKFISEPCEYLKNKLREAGLEFEEEYMPLYPERYFSMDIAFPEKKIAIEINGNQHYNRDGSLKDYYQKRHDIIEDAGWMVIELHFREPYKENIIDEITEYLNLAP